MIKSVRKTVLVLACLSSVSAFAATDNHWLKALKTTFKHSRQPSAEFLAGKTTWQCVESRTDGSNEALTYKISKAGVLVLVENVNNANDSYSFVADPTTHSLASVSAESGIQLFARETPNSEILIEMTSKDATLKTRSTVGFWLKIYGYIACSVQ